MKVIGCYKQIELVLKMADSVIQDSTAYFHKLELYLLEVMTLINHLQFAKVIVIMMVIVKVP
jgi:hypothetical protein